MRTDAARRLGAAAGILVLVVVGACGEGSRGSPGGPTSAAGAPATAPAGVVVAVEGQVTARRAAADAALRPLAEGAEVFADDTVTVAAGASISVQLRHNERLWTLSGGNAGEVRRLDATAAWKAPRGAAGGALAALEGAGSGEATAGAGRHAEREAATTTTTSLSPDLIPRAPAPEDAKEEEREQAPPPDDLVTRVKAPPREDRAPRRQRAAPGGGAGGGGAAAGDLADGLLGGRPIDPSSTGNATDASRDPGAAEKRKEREVDTPRGGASAGAKATTTTKTTTTAAPALTIAGLAVEGGANADAVSQQLRGRAPALRACAAGAPKGELRVTFTVSAGGAVSAVTIVGDTLGVPAAAACVAAQLRSLRLPAAEGATSVKVTLRFAPIPVP